MQEKVGVCFDTCHVWDGGYDIVGHLDEVPEEFDRVIGLERLCAVYFNDSLNECGSHKDRHAKIGDMRRAWEICRRSLKSEIERNMGKAKWKQE